MYSSVALSQLEFSVVADFDFMVFHCIFPFFPWRKNEIYSLFGFGLKNLLLCCQGFVSAVSNMRPFVPAVYDFTVAIPKSSPPPTMLRLFRGQPSVVSIWKLGLVKLQ